jgi:hypothetical protein
MKELLAAADVDNVPNARDLWKPVFDVMGKQGYLTHTPYPHVMKNGKKKHISAYKLSTDMCIDGVIAELKLNNEEGEWLKKVTACAGRVSQSQTFMDQYMR